MPTYRSSTPETRIIIEREPSGRQRVAKAVRNPDSTRLWDLSVELPSGRGASGTFTGPDAEVNIALAQAMARTDLDWMQDRGNGDRRPTEAPDRNVRVYEDGTFAAPTIIPRR